MTKPKPADICPSDAANFPRGYTSFSASEPEAYLWFYVAGAAAGDVFSSEYYMPSGQFYSDPSGSFDPLDQGGDWCFLDPAFKIAGHPPASAPGVWTVRVKVNGALLFSLTFTITATGTGGGSTTTGYGNNLIQNPNAEASTATPDCSPGTPVPNWTATGQFTVCFYGASGYPSATDPGPPSRGNNFFFGGFAPDSTGSQSIDVSWAAADIDRGGVTYILSGYLGGFDGQDDNVTVKALFRSSPFGAATQAAIGPVFSAERNGATGLLLKSASGTVPAGTRQVDIVQEMIRVSGSANDGYSDNLSFVLTLGSSATCSFSLQPLSQNIPAGGSTSNVQVTAGAGCAWTAVSNIGWITILSGASGSGNGTVSYRVGVNTATTPRTGTLTIAGLTHTVTQAAAPVCSYSITPTTNTISAQGGSSSVRLTTADGCPWTASANNSWIALTSATSGTGSATISYSAGANTSTQPRSGTVTIAGLTFSLTQSGGASGGSGPGVSQGGIVNAASNRAGAIGRGSFFTIYGTNIGPAAALQASYPIPDTLGGVVVTVSQGSTARRAYLQYVSATQINAILPSDAPLGNAQLTVSFQGTSTPAALTVADSAFGIFSTAGGSGPGIIQNYVSAGSAPLNTQMSPAKPGQTMILWGTGLGPISTDDNQPPAGGDMPVPVEVRVGGKLAPRLYSGRAPGFAGVDNVYFQVPPDAPPGCSVPVQIKAGANWSNEVRMAISSDGTRCSDPGNPFSGLTANGGKIGAVVLLRVGLNGQLDASQPPVDATIDLGLGLFAEIKAGGELGFSQFLSLPPLGTCVSTAQTFDLGSLLGGGGLLNSTTARQLDAGAALTVAGPKGSKQLPHSSPTATAGPYVGLLGGTLPISDAQPLDTFLDGGSFTVSGPGGTDVGAFSTSLMWPIGITWTNESQIGAINRASGLTLNWTRDVSQVVLIAGASTDQKTKNSGGFFCLAPAAAGSFTVPPSTLADLPATGATMGLSDSIAVVAIASLPMSNLQKFTARGLDAGFVVPATLWVKTVQVQ